jgi:hypothetical protein
VRYGELLWGGVAYNSIFVQIIKTQEISTISPHDSFPIRREYPGVQEAKVVLSYLKQILERERALSPASVPTDFST